MTRKRKSRKPGLGSIGATKTDKALLDKGSDKKPKKKTGKTPGNRQQEAVRKNKDKQTSHQQKDPRIGSKKPIVLVKEQAKPTEKKAKPVAKASAIAAIRYVDSEPCVTEQLAALENDTQLQLILSKQEEGEPLSDSEVDYYNEMMDKYEALSAQLEQEVDEEISDKPLSDDDLWDKLDSSDLSKFE